MPRRFTGIRARWPPEPSSACWSIAPRPRRWATTPPDSVGGSRSGTLVALSTPPFGLSYYRLRSTWVSPSLADPAVSVTQTLITHNTGVTFVQSLADGIAIGATARFVRGIAGSTLAAGRIDSTIAWTRRGT